MDIFQTLRIIHILAGSIAFLVAPVALIVKKGGKAHRQWGKIFFWSMTLVALTAVIMAPLHNNLFLTLVAVFSFYLAFTGYRSIYRKNFYKDRKTAFIDWFFVILNSLFSLCLLVYGLILLPKPFGVIATVFGLLGCSIGIRDIRTFINPPKEKNQWLFSHMIGMVSAYIAAVSAFSAVNLNFDWLPAAVQWLWPTLIGTPLLNRWVSSYRRKFNKGRRITDVVIVSGKTDAP